MAEVPISPLPQRRFELGDPKLNAAFERLLYHIERHGPHERATTISTPQFYRFHDPPLKIYQTGRTNLKKWDVTFMYAMYRWTLPAKVSNTEAVIEFVFSDGTTVERRNTGASALTETRDSLYFARGEGVELAEIIFFAENVGVDAEEVDLGQYEIEGVGSSNEVELVTFMRLDGTDDYAETPDHADLDVTGDIDVRCAVALTEWAPGDRPEGQSLVSKWNNGGLTGEKSYLFRVRDDGFLQLFYTSDGSTQPATLTATEAVPAEAGDLLLVRATFDVSVRAMNYYTKEASAPEAFTKLRENTGWTKLGNTVSDSGETSIHAGTAPLWIGAHDSVNGPADGDFYGAIVLDGIDSIEVTNPNFSDAVVGSTEVTDETGKTYTLKNGAVIAE